MTSRVKNALWHEIISIHRKGDISLQDQLRRELVRLITDNLFSDDALLTPATESAGKARNPNEKREMLLDINALVAQGTLRIHWSYSKLKFQESTIQSLAHQTLDTLQYFIDHCMSDTHDGGLVPEDFPEMDLANDELDALLDNI